MKRGVWKGQKPFSNVPLFTLRSVCPFVTGRKTSDFAALFRFSLFSWDMISWNYQETGFHRTRVSLPDIPVGMTFNMKRIEEF